MNEVVIKPSLREQFLQGWAQCRVIFFSAPCGFGKSTAATALLSNHKTCVFSAEDAQRPGRPANALRMDPRKSGAALRHFKPRRAARLAYAVPLYGAFAAHRGQRFAV